MNSQKRLSLMILTGMMLMASATPALVMTGHAHTNHPTATIHETPAEQETHSHSGHGHHITIHQPELAAYQAIQSGSWSDPGVWQNGAIPTENSTIAIPNNIEVTIEDKITQRFKSIAIDGTLRFATDRDTELWVDTLTSSDHGRLEIGTADNPVAADVTTRIVFADLGEIDLAEDPKQLGRGAILAGPVEIYGAEKTHRLTVAVFPTAGSQSLSLNDTPTGWRVGDELIITGSQGSTSDEVRYITAIEGQRICSFNS